MGGTGAAHPAVPTRGKAEGQSFSAGTAPVRFTGGAVDRLHVGFVEAHQPVEHRLPDTDTGLRPRLNDYRPCAHGRLIAFNLSPGQTGDVRPAAASLTPQPLAKHLLADTAYDSDRFRTFLTERGSTPVIHPNPSRKNVPPFDKTRYKGRTVVERAFSHLKDWRRVATRYDKLARNFRSSVCLAGILAPDAPAANTTAGCLGAAARA